MTEWHRVVFSDESRFCLSSDSRRVRVWRRRGERSNPAAIVERPTVRQRGIMVWGAIAYDSRSPLLRIQGTMTAQRYVDDVLRPVTLPYLQGVPNALYQQDNARPHTARISQQALQDVQMLPWPPYSPDLSPIEHVWDIIGRRLHALPQPRSEDELWQMVEREWRAIPQDAIRTLIDSLPRRVAACIAATVGDFFDGAPALARSTRAALLDAQHLGAFCQRLLRENASSSYHAEYEAETIVLRGSATPITRLPSQRARRALDSARLQAHPTAELAARWTLTVDVPRSIPWVDLRRNCFSGHDADVALRLALHALPHPDDPASRRANCAACGSSDGSLTYIYWSCRAVRPLLREVFASCEMPLDLQAWLFGVGLHPEAVNLTSVAKATIYKYHLGLSWVTPANTSTCPLCVKEPSQSIGGGVFLAINPDMTRSYRNCNNCHNTQLTPDHIYPAGPLYGRHQSRRGHSYGTSVGRYCDQDAWTDLICSMDKTPPPPRLAGCTNRSNLLHGQDTTTTSVGRYCDQDARTDLICSLDKTPPPPQLTGCMDRSDLFHEQDTTTTSVGRYCDQGVKADLICSMDKTPPPSQLAGILRPTGQSLTCATSPGGDFVSPEPLRNIVEGRSNNGGLCAETLPMTQRNFPPSFWDSSYQSSASSELYPPDPYHHHHHHTAGFHHLHQTAGPDPWHSPYPLAGSQPYPYPSPAGSAHRFNPQYGSLLLQQGIRSRSLAAACPSLEKATSEAWSAAASRYHEPLAHSPLGHMESNYASTFSAMAEKRIDAFEMYCWRRMLRISWTAKSILSQMSEDDRLLCNGIVWSHQYTILTDVWATSAVDQLKELTGLTVT
ncbi:hypothetical protein LAZ67_2005243 [Cordylochernes scorpioides]|uniref:Tc1-like transposase DDE domain-containing protein n=1 Tax=Cordylochernes scorpioides TaxID=51811 RepID=A0ABY6K4D4_9ARAC|nr:hypothetical protein LAZ67_2005243 [Cordylochernes scorpioides]